MEDHLKITLSTISSLKKSKLLLDILSAQPEILQLTKLGCILMNWTVPEFPSTTRDQVQKYTVGLIVLLENKLNAEMYTGLLALFSSLWLPAFMGSQKPVIEIKRKRGESYFKDEISDAFQFLVSNLDESD